VSILAIKQKMEPKMKPFIYGEKSGIYIIDLKKLPPV